MDATDENLTRFETLWHFFFDGKKYEGENKQLSTMFRAGFKRSLYQMNSERNQIIWEIFRSVEQFRSCGRDCKKKRDKIPTTIKRRCGDRVGTSPCSIPMGKSVAKSPLPASGCANTTNDENEWFQTDQLVDVPISLWGMNLTKRTGWWGFRLANKIGDNRSPPPPPAGGQPGSC